MLLVQFFILMLVGFMGTLDIQARKDLSTEEIECCSDDE